MNELARRLENHGFDRVPTVRDLGEFAVRGGILDVFVPGSAEPLRLDFFGDTLESIRAFDAATQRTTGQRKSFDLSPMSEVVLNAETVSRFRTRYIQTFGAARAMTRSMPPFQRAAGLPAWSIGCRCSTSGWIRCLTMCPARRWYMSILCVRRLPSGGS